MARAARKRGGARMRSGGWVRFVLNLRPAEYRKLESLSKGTGGEVSMAEFVRRAIRGQYAVQKRGDMEGGRA